MDWDVWDARAYQSVHEAGVGSVDTVGRILTAEEVRIALRPQYADAGDGLPVDEDRLVRLAPSHHRLRRVVHAAVLVVGRNVVPPRLDSTRDAGDHPHLRLRSGLARDPIITRPRLVHRHALRRELIPAHHRMDALAGLAVLLEARVVVPSLMVQHQNA